MDKLVLIDGHAILHRAFHALPPLTTSSGIIINAVFGFTSIMLRVINDLKPTHLIVTFDRPKPTFRKKLYANYQAKRPKMDESLVPQIKTVHTVLREMGIEMYELDGFEADDIIGTIINKLKTEKLESIIVTGDRDLLQLVNEQTKVYMPVKGISESKLFGEDEVKDKFGINPSQIVDYKALVGDSSDNYPGVPGIGPKTASSLLNRFQTLEKLYEDIDKVENEGLKKKLKDNIESAKMSKQLATILTDVPIIPDLDKCRLKDFDSPSVHALFERMEFRSLIPRLGNNRIRHSTFNIQQTKESVNKDKAEKDQQISLF